MTECVTKELDNLKRILIFRNALFWVITQRVLVISYLFLNPEYGTDRLSRNVGTILPLLAT